MTPPDLSLWIPLFFLSNLTLYIHLVWLCIIHLDWNNQCYFQEPCLFFLFVFCNHHNRSLVCRVSCCCSSESRRQRGTNTRLVWMEGWWVIQWHRHVQTHSSNKAWSKLDYGPLLAPQLGLLVTLDVKGNEWECRWGSIWARWHRAGTLPGLSHCAISYLILSPYHPLHAGFFFFFFVLLYRVCTDSIYAADCTQINVCVALSMLLKRNQCRSPWCWSWIRTRDVIYSANYKPLPSWLHV